MGNSNAKDRAIQVDKAQLFQVSMATKISNVKINAYKPLARALHSFVCGASSFTHCSIEQCTVVRTIPGCLFVQQCMYYTYCHVSMPYESGVAHG